MRISVSDTVSATSIFIVRDNEDHPPASHSISPHNSTWWLRVFLCVCVVLRRLARSFFSCFSSAPSRTNNTGRGQPARQYSEEFRTTPPTSKNTHQRRPARPARPQPPPPPTTTTIFLRAHGSCIGCAAMHDSLGAGGARGGGRRISGMIAWLRATTH